MYHNRTEQNIYFISDLSVAPRPHNNITIYSQCSKQEDHNEKRKEKKRKEKKNNKNKQTNKTP